MPDEPCVYMGVALSVNLGVGVSACVCVHLLECDIYILEDLSGYKGDI